MKIRRSVPALPRFIRLVDTAVRRVDSLSPRYARKRHRGVRSDILEEQDGRAAIPGLQPGRRRLFYGCLFR